MTIASFAKFDTYRSLIESLPSSFSDDDVISQKFLLEKEETKNLEIYYAPFEHINEKAKVVIIGITPGLHQMKKSFSTVLDLKDQALGDEEILHEVKKSSSFEGPMRKNLIQMLDELKLHHFLGLSSTSDLFNTASDLVQTTSVITYPVFFNGQNFSGSRPNILKTEVLKKYVIDGFAKEMSSLDNPLMIPLGVNVSKVLEYLATHDYIQSENILTGFPHPSGGNGHRHRQFADNKEGMKAKIVEYFRGQKSF